MEANRVLLREYRLTMRFHLLPVLPVLYTVRHTRSCSSVPKLETGTPKLQNVSLEE